MLLTLRQAIMQKVQDKPNEDIFELINNSVDADEKALPGLGVLFELIWQHCGDEMQTQLVNALQDGLKQVGSNKA